MPSLNPKYVLEWKYGMPALSFWESNIDMIQKFTKGMRPINVSHYLTDDAINLAAAELQGTALQKRVIPKKLWPRPYPGGLRIPHVHFKGELYLLDDVKWKKFTKEVVSNFQEKLANAGKINFEQLMDLSTAIEKL